MIGRGLFSCRAKAIEGHFKHNAPNLANHSIYRRNIVVFFPLY